MWKVVQIFASLLLLIGVSNVNCGENEKNIQLTGIDTPPYGPFYCQARCLASCIETALAPSLEECAKYCPPFERAMACQNADCWRNCGIPSTPRDKPAPPAVNFVMAQYASSADDRLQDPFTIELTWDPAPSASLYIVELFPLNRTPRPGENNFFRALTAFPTYLVRKEDECTIYDIRVMPVNAFGVGAPQYTRIEAPRPTMSSDDFVVNNIKRDPGSNSVIVTIYYAIPSTWPVIDVDLTGLRVQATDCRGLAGKSNGTAGDVWYPAYDVHVEKAPTPAVRLAFLNEVVKADCAFQMRVSALTTRCNTTTYFDSSGSGSRDSTVGADFRINCLTAEGFTCDDGGSQSTQPPPPKQRVPDDRHHVVPAGVEIVPGVVPASSGPVSPQVDDSPTGSVASAPVPELISTGNDTVSAPSGSISEPDIVILPQNVMVDGGPADTPVGTNNNRRLQPFLIDYLAINSQLQVPMSCDIDTIDVQASPSASGVNLVDLAVKWMEQNLGPRRVPAYFLVRYGPVLRRLVEDTRRPRRIIPGYENVVRAGRPTGMQHLLEAPLEREIRITDVPRNSLIAVQVCAIYDSNIEKMMLWDVIPSQYVDLMALELSAAAVDSITSKSPLITDESPPSAAEYERQQFAAANGGENSFVDEPPPNSDDNDRENMFRQEEALPPVVIRVGVVDTGRSSVKLWSVLAGVVFAALIMAVIAFVAYLYKWSKQGAAEKKMNLVKSYPVIATITQAQTQQQNEKEGEEPEKVALP